MKATQKKVYKFAAGFRLPKEADPQSVGERVEQLRAEHGDGYVGAEQVVREASDPESPLHKAFPPEAWDDTSAAHQYRLTLGRHLIRSVIVTIITPKRETIVVGRAFRELPQSAPDKKRPYLSTEDALRNAETREELLQRAFNEALAWRRRYARLSELATIFTAIDRAAKSRRSAG